MHVVIDAVYSGRQCNETKRSEGTVTAKKKGMVHTTEHKHANDRGAGCHIGEKNGDSHNTWKQQVVRMGRGQKRYIPRTRSTRVRM
jgi:hypothetical protein